MLEPLCLDILEARLASEVPTAGETGQQFLFASNED
jgi:hypothetical protein